MKRAELEGIARGIAPVMRKTIADTFNLLALRVRALELREPAGRHGQDVAERDAKIAALEERLAKIEARPSLEYRGVWSEGTLYAKGSTVTWGGALWIALSATSARPGIATADSRSWQLACKGGRDGKPGKDGRDGKDWNAA